MHSDLTIEAEPGFEDEARVLAQRLGLKYIYNELDPIPTKADSATKVLPAFLLHINDQGLTLLEPGADNKGIKTEFIGGVLNHRRLYGGGKGQDIAKAVGISAGFQPEIVDLTGGLGRDAFVFASLGCRVHICERNPIIFALLEDGITRAQNATVEDKDLEIIIQRMTIQHIDGSNYLQNIPGDQLPDVIYLDPMFPARNKSARVKKEMAIFHKLLADEPDAADLLAPALKAARYRVVVKRPAHAPFLAETKPSYSRKGKSIRFDIYAIKKLPDSPG